MLVGLEDGYWPIAAAAMTAIEYARKHRGRPEADRALAHQNYEKRRLRAV